jgi:hypothetical protein
MPYDRELADRIRTRLAQLPEVREVPMFGGLAFLVGGKMVASASGQGDLLVRCDPAATGELLKREDVAVAQMGRRTMSAGWLRVTGEGVANPDTLDFWLSAALARTARQAGEGARAK